MIEQLREQQIASMRARRKKARRRRRSIILLVVIITLGSFLTVQFAGNRSFGITHYDLTSAKLEDSLRIAVMSDLHSREFGEKNADLVAAVAEEKPDLIAMVGDMVNQDDTDISVIRTLCKQLQEIAPVYYSMGNHEGYMTITRTDSIALHDILKEDGVHVLYNQVEEFTKGDTTICLAGISTAENNYDKWSKSALEKFWEFDGYKILLSHYPSLYYEKLKDAKMDLALAGHYHGGIVQIPGIGGLYHPVEGFFPKYSGGEYQLTYGTLIVSRGMGDQHFSPRINNRPELIIIDIEQRKGETDNV